MKKLSTLLLCILLAGGSFAQSKIYISLGAGIGFLIEQVGAVAGHAHVLESDHQEPLIGFRQESEAAPFHHNPGNRFPVFLVVLHLLCGHGHEERFVETFGELLQNLFFCASDQNLAWFKLD